MPQHSKIPPAPEPTRIFFDPFNSSSTGHQRAEARIAGSTSWRDSRSYKLKHQFQDVSGRGGEAHLSDLVGAGSKDWGKDGRKENGNWEKGAPGLREKGWQDISTLMDGCRKRTCDDSGDEITTKKTCTSSEGIAKATATASQPETEAQEAAVVTVTEYPQIFRGLTIYLNGSTAPLVSDHRLKQLFAQHGGNSSIALGRRTVTHVILGKTCGGGLASTKIQKEVTTVSGKGIKYVTAQWVLDSVEKGIRQSEGKYMLADIAKRIGGSGQISVRQMFTPKTVVKKE